MTRRRTPGGKTPLIRLAGIGLVATGVAATLYVTGRVHIADPAASLFGRQYLAAVALKSLLASAVLGLAALQVLLALWMYRKLPLAGSRRAQCGGRTGSRVSHCSRSASRSQCIA